MLIIESLILSCWFEMLPLPCAKFQQILMCGFVSKCFLFVDLFIIGLHQCHVVLWFFLFFLTYWFSSCQSDNSWRENCCLCFSKWPVTSFSKLGSRSFPFPFGSRSCGLMKKTNLKQLFFLNVTINCLLTHSLMEIYGSLLQGFPPCKARFFATENRIEMISNPHFCSHHFPALLTS